tara:strand:+ start:199 stop:546 length:348 start_codon:yes stop_codon:yes gene_type:complete
VVDLASLEINDNKAFENSMVKNQINIMGPAQFARQCLAFWVRGCKILFFHRVWENVASGAPLEIAIFDWSVCTPYSGFQTSPILESPHQPLSFPATECEKNLIKPFPERLFIIYI